MLSFSEFQKTVRQATNEEIEGMGVCLDEYEGADVKFMIYADMCYLESWPNEGNSGMFYCLCGNQDVYEEYPYDVEKFLYNNYYVHEAA